MLYGFNLNHFCIILPNNVLRPLFHCYFIVLPYGERLISFATATIITLVNKDTANLAMYARFVLQIISDTAL